MPVLSLFSRAAGNRTFNVSPRNMATSIQRVLELAEEIEKHPLSECGPSDDSDMQTAYLYSFKDVAKRFVAYARRFDNRSLNEMLDSLNLDPEHITQAYDLRADLIPIIDYLKEPEFMDGTGPGLATTRNIAFISYSTADKQYGGHIKRTMESLGVPTFIAHDDLRVSEEWKKRILEELQRTDIFVALLSKDFKLSDWCSQELGYILPFDGVLIIPLSVDGTNPYGFISNLQGHRLRSEEEVGAVLMDVLLRERPRLAISKAIEDVAGAMSFRGAEALVKPLIPHFSYFTESEAAQFAKAAINNGQVWDASLCRGEYLPHFLKIWGSRIPEELRIELEEKIGSRKTGMNS